MPETWGPGPSFAPKPSVLVITTGGTIASTATAQGGLAPVVSGHDLVATVIGLDGIAAVDVVEFSHVLSSQLTLSQVFGLASRLREILATRSGLSGIVVTHGTGTLEESAFLADISHSDPRPVVFTGAMRSQSDLCSDGPLNVFSAVRVAASAAARERGVLVVFNNTIHAARHVFKAHTTSVDAFRSLEAGPLGYVDPDRVRFVARPEAREVLAWDTPEYDVDLVKFVVGMNDRFIRASIDGGAKGLVIEGSGEGNVNEALAGGIAAARQKGIVVAICSRSPAGRTYPIYGGMGGGASLAELGCVFSSFTGPKTRVLLMALLGRSADERQIRRFLDPLAPEEDRTNVPD